MRSQAAFRDHRTNDERIGTVISRMRLYMTRKNMFLGNDQNADLAEK